MKLQDLFEAGVPEAHTIEEFAKLAIDNSRVKFEDSLWGGPKLIESGRTSRVSWYLLGNFGNFGMTKKIGTWIAFEVHDGKAFYATKSVNAEKTHYILDPEKFIEISMRLGYKPSKKHFLHELLTQFKDQIDDEEHARYIRDLIKASRMLGNDYPEFKAIEKSLG